MNKLTAVVVFSVCMLMSAIPASALDLGVRASYWYAILDSSFQVDEGDISGDNLDVFDDLGISNNFFPMIEVWGGLGKHIVTVGYMKSDFTGSETLDQTVTFDGNEYEAGIEIDSELDVKVLEVTYEYRILKLNALLAGFDVGLLGNIKFANIDTTLDSAEQTNSSDWNSWIPAVGAKAHLQILAGLLEARAQLLIGPISGRQSGDLVMELSLTPFPFLDISAGWRTLILDLRDEGFEFDHRFDGPFLAVSFSW